MSISRCIPLFTLPGAALSVYDRHFFNSIITDREVATVGEGSGEMFHVVKQMQNKVILNRSMTEYVLYYYKVRYCDASKALWAGIPAYFTSNI